MYGLRDCKTGRGICLNGCFYASVRVGCLLWMVHSIVFLAASTASRTLMQHLCRWRRCTNRVVCTSAWTSPVSAHIEQGYETSYRQVASHRALTASLTTPKYLPCSPMRAPVNPSLKEPYSTNLFPALRITSAAISILSCAPVQCPIATASLTAGKYAVSLPPQACGPKITCLNCSLPGMP